MTGRGDIDGLVDDARLDITITPRPASLDLDVAVGVDQLGPVLGTKITDASLRLSSRASRWSGSLGGRIEVLDASARVAGSIDLGAGEGFDARLAMAFDNASRPRLGGLTVDGSLVVALTAAPRGVTSSLEIDGSASFSGATIGIDGSLAAGAPSGLIGTLAIDLPDDGLPLGRADSPFTLTGDVELAVSPTAISFVATDAGLAWRVAGNTVGEFTIDTFAMSTDGSVTIDAAAHTFTAPGGFRLTTPDVDLTADAGFTNLRLALGAGTVRIPGVADGSPGRPLLATPAITISATSDFRRVLTAGQLNLGLLTIEAKLVFEGTDGVFRLAIEPLSALRPARVSIDGMAGALRIDGTAFIASDGTFDVGVSAIQLGPNALSLRNVAARLSKTTTSIGSLRLRVTGGSLALAVGDPIPLPNLDVTPFSMSATSRFDETITVPGMTFGPALSTTSATVRFRQLNSGAFSLNLVESASVRALGATQRLSFTRLLATSTGSFDGSITGRLTLFGTRLATATFDVDTETLPSGARVVKVAVPESRAATFNLGFTSTKLFGFVRSDGVFSFASTIGVDVNIGVARMTGEVAVTVANSGISGRFTGTAEVFFVGRAEVTATMSDTGYVDATAGIDTNNNRIPDRFFDVSFQIGT
ncbi:MAG: hypothetical protein ACK5OX_01585, partial [Desertimonas sp.]